MNTYIFYTDPGHGWVKVARSELVRLGILGKISRYSYESGDWVFLEEDCDATKFHEAKISVNEKVEYVTHDVETTPIRNYRHFSVKTYELPIKGKTPVFTVQ